MPVSGFLVATAFRFQFQLGYSLIHALLCTVFHDDLTKNHQPSLHPSPAIYVKTPIHLSSLTRDVHDFSHQ